MESALKVLKDVVDRIDPSQLPLVKSDYLKLLTLCMRFGGFTFNSQEYIQRSGLAMGSPLSPVAACLYLEWLEKHRFQDIMGADVLWVRYVDDVLLVAPQTMDLNEKLNEINSVDPKIQFTMENENQGTIPFLDTEIVRSGNQVKFKVYRKPTNREDYVHFYSGHSERVKRGVVLGFFLRALRICSDDYVDDEVQHVITSFMKLKYPQGLLLSLERKATKIRSKNKTNNRNKDVRYIYIPNSKAAVTIAKELETTRVKVALTSDKKIGGMVSEKRPSEHRELSVVYQVPCGRCDKCYVGETGRGLGKRLTEHKRDLRNDHDYSAFVSHSHSTHHLPNWDGASILAFCNNKANRKATEAAYIATNDTINTRVGFIKWAKPAALFSIRNIERRSA